MIKIFSINRCKFKSSNKNKKLVLCFVLALSKSLPYTIEKPQFPNRQKITLWTVSVKLLYLPWNKIVNSFKWRKLNLQGFWLAMELQWLQQVVSLHLLTSSKANHNLWYFLKYLTIMAKSNGLKCCCGLFIKIFKKSWIHAIIMNTI